MSAQVIAFPKFGEVWRPLPVERAVPRGDIPASAGPQPFTPGLPVLVRNQPNGPVMLVLSSGPHETEAVVVRDYGGPGQVVIVTAPTASRGGPVRERGAAASADRLLQGRRYHPWLRRGLFSAPPSRVPRLDHRRRRVGPQGPPHAPGPVPRGGRAVLLQAVGGVGARFAAGAPSRRVRGDRLLDGREHNGMPGDPDAAPETRAC